MANNTVSALYGAIGDCYELSVLPEILTGPRSKQVCAPSWLLICRTTGKIGVK